MCFRWEAALALLAAGADIGARDNHGRTPSDFAAWSFHRDLWWRLVDDAYKADGADSVRELLRKDPKAVRYWGPYGTILHAAVSLHNPELASVLIEAGADTNATDEDGATALHLAPLEMVRLLVNKGANVNARDKHGRTALHRAVLSPDAVKKAALLLELGADPLIRDNFGDTAMRHAATGARPSTEVIQLLLKHGERADVHSLAALGRIDELTRMFDQDAALVDDARNGFGRSPLHVAANYGQVDVVKLLLLRGADPNRADRCALSPDGYTPLHLAAVRGRLTIVELLLAHGANVHATTSLGDTPLHDSTHEAAIVRCLIRHGADVNAANRYGETPLHRAAGNGSIAAIGALLAAGADPNARDNQNRTPLDRANVLKEQVVAVLGPVTARSAP